MDSFTHYYIYFNTKDKNASIDEFLKKYSKDENLLIFSNSAADIDNFARILKTTYKPKYFFNFHSRTFNQLDDFSLGLSFHGEQTKINKNIIYGIDYYTHKEDGYIERLRRKTSHIFEKYNINLKEFDHGFLEYVTGYLLANENPELKKQYLKFCSEHLDEKLKEFAEHLTFAEKIILKPLLPLISEVLKKYNTFLDDPLPIIYKTYALGSKRIDYLFKENKPLKIQLELAFNELMPIVNEELNLKTSYFNTILEIAKDIDYNLLQEETSYSLEKKPVYQKNYEK
ncbi:MAG: hypothetical protein QW210_01505 [Candidatus Woesearchaeota archaeon]